MNVSISGRPIETVKSTKLLSLHINDALTWSIHVKKTRAKVLMQLGLLLRIRKFLTRQARLAYYNAIIQSVMDNSTTIWGNSTAATGNTMLLLQKHAAHITTDSKWDPQSDVLFKGLNIVPIQESKESKGKDHLQSFKWTISNLLFKEVSLSFHEIHAKVTRNSAHNIVLTKVNKGLVMQTFTFSSAKIWNSLPNEIKACKSYDGFSNQLKSVTLSAYLAF